MTMALNAAALRAAVAAFQIREDDPTNPEPWLVKAIEAYVGALPGQIIHGFHNRPYDEFGTAVDHGIRNGDQTRETFPWTPGDVADITARMNNLVAICHGMSVAAGWYQDPATGESLLEFPNVGEKLALVHSEVSEALEGHRKRRADDHLPLRPSIEVELADAVIRICDLAGVLHLDLGGAIAEKMGYNLKRPDHARGSRAGVGGKSI